MWKPVDGGVVITTFLKYGKNKIFTRNIFKDTNRIYVTCKILIIYFKNMKESCY
jgi:hypothetical protein